MSHETPLSMMVFTKPDGSTGELSLHDAEAIHDEEGSVDSENIAEHAVHEDDIAPKAVTSDKIADGAVGKDQLSQEIKDDWDSIFQLHSNDDWNWVEIGDFVVASGYFTKTQTSQSVSYIVQLPKPIYAATITANGWVSGDTSAEVKYTSGDSVTQASFYLWSSRTGVNGGIYVHVMGRLRP